MDDARRVLDEAADVLIPGPTKLYRDRRGMAVYNLEGPVPCALVACPRCRNVALRPGLPDPRVLIARVRCGRCGALQDLQPPPEVVDAAAAMPGLVSRPVRDAAHPRPS